MDRWCIWIDFQGFSTLFSTEEFKTLSALANMMKAIWQIGSTYCSEPGNRLFAHQIGDGFAIVGEFGSKQLDLPLALAAIVMRAVAGSEYWCKASIGEGSWADITSIYPSVVLDHRDDHGSVRMGGGLMTIQTVMGMAQINAHSIQSSSPKGPVLTLSRDAGNRISTDWQCKLTLDSKILSVDWIHSTHSLIDKILMAADLTIPGSQQIEENLRNYIREHSDLPKKWVEGAREYLNLMAT